MEYIIKNIKDLNENNYLEIYNIVAPEVKKKINKYIHDKQKKLSLLGEYCLIDLLKKHKINYQNINFITNQNGKRYIKDSNVFFNISHSNEYIIVVISNKEIGVDIQEIKDININTINQFATDEEIKYITSSKTKSEYSTRLFNIYTLKEAYIKMKGANMNYSKDVSFLIDNNNKIICSDKTISITTLNNILKGYSISICEKKI